MTNAVPLTLERMRADIAKALDESPEIVTDDENLIDLGLDSMRVLVLTTQWAETGIPLQFSDLAAHVTLAGWWEVVQRLQAGSAAQK
ncbi:MAG: phosphopantetheine-binding protein [Moraxellaceae bacterium]|nr:phosphopantetheine-binding protein [Moraxellaceae bacterium]